MEKILRFFEKYIIPKFLYRFGQPIYHYLLSFIGAFIYRFPSRKLIIIGVTGTKGKTTTCNLIHHILNSSGHKTGLITTVNFKIGDKEWQNGLKQTMPGRFYLQKLLKQMSKEGCEYAVVETSSEGILQYRHQFIDYNVAVFTNLTPEHLERHNGFENYRTEKVKLFEKVASKNGIGVYNLDDENVEYFLRPEMKEKYGHLVNSKQSTDNRQHVKVKNILEIKNIKLSSNVTEFEVGDVKYKTNLLGEFNVYNCSTAISVAMSQNITVEQIQKSIESFKPISGRMEIIDEGQDFAVIIDYAHEPNSLESIYKAVKETQMISSADSGQVNHRAKMICLLGSCGGGRDKWKRPLMGKIAATYCDEIILTNEDPYDENPEVILDEIEAGFLQILNFKLQILKNYWKIIDRKEAIKKALSLAKKGDAVVLTGKGGEMWMCVKNGKKISWDEKEIVIEILKL
ncbi:hypothetical protein COV23_00840 [Candidatus Wolfebacteria bacterium CG10_big_fil_rev_8_21_14_0_10_31_9]|uniref:UDP-N-acetylmuramoyl-L-alanyl-D-glutamate--2, 6-diaminopimelate ligase n=1 Tax=Candidatus Wolfebacteria bacterium CG10_big_fil_rev_8_21_14_0_10_31_9 TaxID=1975070 RepID=A0A2H0RCQ1_9BACT|nr:MAG: hypothetical protein COV23_00840 [Candidatus Wolfebacteria bacterium CG10_big_fil_rev_8_21_14_0_10_31_9]